MLILSYVVKSIDTQLQKKLGSGFVPVRNEFLFEEWKEYDRLSSENKIVIPDAVLEKTNDYVVIQMILLVNLLVIAVWRQKILQLV